MLHMYTPGSMPSCSKAARGLLVLLRTDGIFTVNALSPSSSSRQYPYHYAIRAGQNLLDKEFRYLRTVPDVSCISLCRADYIITLTRAWRIVSEDSATHLLFDMFVFGYLSSVP